MERKEFSNKGSRLATICVTQPRKTCAKRPGLSRFCVLVRHTAYKRGTRAVL